MKKENAWKKKRTKEGMEIELSKEEKACRKDRKKGGVETSPGGQ